MKSMCEEHPHVDSISHAAGRHSREATQSVNVYEIDPLTDPRWKTFVATHPDASVYHGISWLGALRDAYGYMPAADSLVPRRSFY